MKVLVAPDARFFLASEAKYLKARSPQAAGALLGNLKRLKHNLSQFPRMGHAVEDMPVPGVLRFVMSAYLVDYEMRDELIVILAIRHARQRPPGTPIVDDFDFEEP